MPESKSLPFQYTAGPAGELRVTTADGVVHLLNVGLMVFSVTDNGAKNPDGSPQFEVRASIQFDRPKAQP